MITQLVLDWWVGGIAILINSVPLSPAVFVTVLYYVNQFASWSASNLSQYGSLIPWGAVQIVVGWWVGMLVFWTALIPVRLLLFLLRGAR